ncbi:MAG: site-specific integrase [Phycisphaeraceae bacterium]|nr:site-specific integrase [Phycisphaeraceae bacterium]
MASVVRDPNGRKRILFTDGDGERKAIRLGVVSVKAAESFRLRVEAILSATEMRQPLDADTSAWLAELPERMHKRLVRVGLVAPRVKPEALTLGAMLDRFEKAVTVKASTMIAYGQALRMLRDHFGESTPLASITPAHADEWRKAITEPTKGKRLATATVSKRVRVAKAVFRKAVKWGLIQSSPFADLRGGAESNRDRSHYVDRPTVAKVLEACPDDEWRAIVALVRFAGLRCPSEVGLLRWGDVNWERGRLTVRSPKTAGHEGHALRMVPIPPELRPILLALFDAAEPGAVAVVPGLSDAGINLRTHFERIIGRAGVKAWPRLYHNLRASCATDWVERFPAHVVAGWLGHSPMIAATHYLQTRDAHFDLAAGFGTPDEGGAKSGAESGAQAAQNAAQHPTASDRTDSPDESEVLCFAGVSRDDANECESTRNEQVAPLGFEPRTKRL